MFIPFIVLFLWKRYDRIKCERSLRNSLENGTPLPIEIFYGPYKVVSKLLENRLSMKRVYERRLVGRVIEVAVPPKMYKRIKEDCFYYFSFDHRSGEIHFDQGLCLTEMTEIPKEDIKEGMFRLKAKILEKLTREIRPDKSPEIIALHPASE